MDIIRLIYRSLLKATALFFALFSLFNLVVTYFGASRFEDIWWIDLSWLPSPLPAVISVLAALLLLLFALVSQISQKFRQIMGIFFIGYALISLINTLSFYKALAEQTITTSFFMPFSLVVTLFIILIALQLFFGQDPKFLKTEIVLTLVFAFLWVLVFPLAQIKFFGSTDYSRSADAAVIFGARYYADGTLSTSLKNRMDKGIELLENGLVDYLILTGGVDADGIDETEGMKNYALERGVNPSQLIIDNEGVNTDISVANTVRIAKEHNFKTLIAVSHNYHLPRIKMAYRAARVNVYTVPAVSTVPSAKDFQLTLREIPGFWVYYFRSALRDLSPAIVQ